IEGDLVLFKALPSPDRPSFSPQRHYFVEVDGVSTPSPPLACGKWAVGYMTSQGVLSHAEIVDVVEGTAQSVRVASRETGDRSPLPKEHQTAARYGIACVLVNLRSPELFLSRQELSGPPCSELLLHADSFLAEGQSLYSTSKSGIKGGMVWINPESEVLIPRNWITFGFHFDSIGLQAFTQPGEIETLKASGANQVSPEEKTSKKIRVKVDDSSTLASQWVIGYANWGLFLLPVETWHVLPVGKTQHLEISFATGVSTDNASGQRLVTRSYRTIRLKGDSTEIELNETRPKR
ncbi:MAG: hypothetical protein KDB07_00030, partial [Planctomycetes bacterium]|nr:hypothetical protein [Planctomycetota bacterium]